MATLSLCTIYPNERLEITPATIIHCHKVALAFIGIGHLVVEKTQVDLSNESRQRGGEIQKRKSRDQMRKFKDMTRQRKKVNKIEQRGVTEKISAPSYYGLCILLIIPVPDIAAL